MTTTKTAKKAPRPKPAAKRKAAAKAAPTPKQRARMTLADAMSTLEAAGTAQTRKTYARHIGDAPMFGVSFATLKTLHKQIRVDHELACALWDTGNLDARNLAVKIVDPLQLTAGDLDRWVSWGAAPQLCGNYAAMLGAERPDGAATATRWLSAKDEATRRAGWTLLGQLSQRDEALRDEYFAERLAEIERTIHAAPSAEREVMNATVIVLGGRNQALRKAALLSAKKIGVVDVDHGDTACRTPDAVTSIEKAWAHATAKSFASPAAQERGRDRPRLRC
jgi:3-methyladenine DNA glycosylase AlkD